MIHSNLRVHLLISLALLALVLPASAMAQSAAPGDADAPPPSAPAAPAANTDDPAAMAPAPDIDDGSLSFSVEVTHATDDEAITAGTPVTLEALRPPGPMQPDNFRQVSADWTAVTDDAGRATFTDLPDNLAEQGLALQASTSFGGLAFSSDYAAPRPGQTLSLTVYDRTHERPTIRVSQKRVLISMWEDYLVFDQFWTFRIDGDQAFDIATSPDPSLADGLPLTFPMKAEGISFSGPGDHEVHNNIVRWNHVLVPDQPVTVQVRFSMSANDDQFTYSQEMEYAVDQLQVMAAVDTPFERMPRVEGLMLRAPGFEVGDDPGVIGLQTRNDYLVAHGRSLEPGESYAFRLEGLPFGRPLGGWIALVGGLLMALLLTGFGIREHRRFNAARDDEAILKGLRQQRDAIYDELSQLEAELQQLDDDDDLALELEEHRLMVRQRLTLILRKIDDIRRDAPAGATS